MLYHLLMHYQSELSFLRVVKYITFRTMGAVLTSLLVSFIIGPILIRWLSKMKAGQQIRDYGPKTHLAKAGTPTMGGVLILASALGSSLLWNRLDNPYVWSAVFTAVSFGLVGFVDDFLKIKRKSSDKGLSAAAKMKYQIIASLAVALFLCMGILAHYPVFSIFKPLVGKIFPAFGTDFHLPFVKQTIADIGIFYIPLILLVLVASSNAVNITDGLDGLAIGPVMTAMLTFMVLTYASGHAVIASYLNIPYVAGAGELAVICGAVFGSSLGFLWYNTYPAQVFMGDVGSLPLGALMGLMAVITKNEILLIIIGGVFVLETLSVMIQVFSYKVSGHRVFRMAPLHHHFELKGWAEPKVIVRFWIISIILALISLSTLKLR